MFKPAYSWLSPDFLIFSEAAEAAILPIAQLSATPYVGDIATISRFETGETSAVFKVEGATGICVIKFSRLPEMAQAEASALKIWSTLGVNVPQVYMCDARHELPYTVMEYIRHPLLSEAGLTRELRAEAVREMGRNMRIMHTIPATGYGILNFLNSPVTPQLPDLQSYLDWKLPNRIQYLRENSILDKRLELQLHDAVDTLLSNSHLTLPVLVHDDLQPYNCFYDEAAGNIIIFDPNAQGDAAVMDIGRTYFKLAVESGFEDAWSFLQGYKSEFPAKLIIAGMRVKAAMQFVTWANKERNTRIKRGIEVFQNPRVRW